MSEDDNFIEEFEDFEDPGTVCHDQALGEEVVDEEEFSFLDGLSELASLQSGKLRVTTPVSPLSIISRINKTTKPEPL